MPRAACDKYFTATALLCAMTASLTVVVALSAKWRIASGAVFSVSLAYSFYWVAIGLRTSNDGSGKAGSLLW